MCCPPFWVGFRWTGTGYQLGPLCTDLWVPHGLSTWDTAHFGHVFHKGPNWATGSFVDCFVGSTWSTHIGPSPLWPRVSQKSQLGLHVCWLNVGPTWDSRVLSPFLGERSVDRNWVITGSFVDCFVGPTWAVHVGPSSCWPHVSQRSQLG